MTSDYTSNPDNRQEYGSDIQSTIVVEGGETYDGDCKIFRADKDKLGDGSQGENQKPIFRLEDGATLKNVVIGASGADGIHVYGDVRLENVHWDDIGEDALTVKDDGDVHIDCGSSQKGDDKTFQVNASTNFYVTNFTAKSAGKFMRQNGGKGFHMTVHIDHCDISDMGESIYRTDSSSSTVKMTNTRYSDIGKAEFIFGDDRISATGSHSQMTVENCVEY